ncbi:hypothetical protein QZH41_006608 [Actinostola sp. cb2023]|nr:hypothetical protein QZH41_006608 [Actinostola sp. cb2023]
MTLTGSLDFGERLDGLIMTIEVGHFSEAFFVQEFTWDELQIHQEQSFQLHQSLGQSIKNSRYYQAIPYIAVECPGLDGDNSSIPIIFEDKYRFCTPDQEEASGKSDLDEIDFAFDDECCDNKNVVDDELVIIDTDISDIPASQDDPNSSFALGGMLCNGRGPFRETMILDDDLENENSDLCKALDEIQHLEDPLNSIDLKSALRDDPDSRHDIAGNNSPEYQERCLVGHGVAPCHNVNGVVEDNTCSVDETSSFSENKKEDNATLMDVPSQETLSTQDEREKSEQNTSGEKCDELEKDNLKNTCNISDQFANSSGIENSGINKIEENVKDTQEMQTESNENTIKETNDKKDCSTSESSTLDSSHQEASSVVEVEPHGQHETSTDSMSKKEPLSPSDRVMSDDTVSSINNKEPGNNLLVPCKGSESISTSNIVASDPPSSNISTCNKEPDEQVNSSVLCRSSNVVTSRDNVSPKSNNKDHGDTNLVSSDFLEDNKASKDETSVAVVDTNLVSSDVLEDNKARQDETSVVDTNLVSSDVLEDNKARQDETSVVDTNLVSGDVLEDNKASQDKTPVVDTNLVSSDVLEDNKASQDKTSVLDTNLVSSDVQVDNKARQDETPVSDDVNNLLQSSNVVTFSSCREGLDTASMDSILSDSKSDSSVYETPVSSEATGSPSNSQPEVSSNTDGNTSPSFSRINSTYGGSIKSRFELAKRFVKRQLKFNWKIYSENDSNITIITTIVVIAIAIIIITTIVVITIAIIIITTIVVITIAIIIITTIVVITIAIIITTIVVITNAIIIITTIVVITNAIIIITTIVVIAIAIIIITTIVVITIAIIITTIVVITNAIIIITTIVVITNAIIIITTIVVIAIAIIIITTIVVITNAIIIITTIVVFLLIKTNITKQLLPN